MCSELLENGANAAKSWRFGTGIAWSILVLLGAPFLMVGGFIFVIWRAQRKKIKNNVGAPLAGALKGREQDPPLH